jgi:hypothetical protein
VKITFSSIADAHGFQFCEFEESASLRVSGVHVTLAEIDESVIAVR